MLMGLLVVAGCLTGCSAEIDQVKGAPSLANGYKVGQVLDNDPNCAKTSWDSSKDANGRTIVQYACIFKITQEMINNNKTERVRAWTRDMQNNSMQIANTKAEMQKDVEIAQEEIVRNAATAQERVEKRQAEVAGYKREAAIAGPNSSAQRAVDEMLGRVDSDKANAQNWSQDRDDAKAAIERKIAKVVEFEPRFNQALEHANQNDEKLLNDYYAQALKAEHRIKFLVADKKVSRIGYEFLLNDQQLSIDFEPMAQMAMALEMPNNRQLEQQWWEIRLGRLLKLEHDRFPFHCGKYEGCVVVNK